MQVSREKLLAAADNARRRVSKMSPAEKAKLETSARKTIAEGKRSLGKPKK